MCAISKATEKEGDFTRAQLDGTTCTKNTRMEPDSSVRLIHDEFSLSLLQICINSFTIGKHWHIFNSLGWNNLSSNSMRCHHFCWKNLRFLLLAQFLRYTCVAFFFFFERAMSTLTENEKNAVFCYWQYGRVCSKDCLRVFSCHQTTSNLYCG